MRVTVDEGLCIGAGQCVFTAPEVFDQREEDGVATVVGEPDAHPDAVREAVGLCPSGALGIVGE